MSTTQIISEIRARLEEEPQIHHPTQIAVSEREGTVTLRGSVSSIAQRIEAARVAKSVAGVQTVENELTVDLRHDIPDDQLRGIALQALMSDMNVPDERIDVGVSASWLTLKGEVRRQSESSAAFYAVAAVPGIGGITNEIKVITAGIDG